MSRRLFSSQRFQIRRWTTLALIRRPSFRLAEGLVTHVNRQEINIELAFQQWENYCKSLHNHGWKTVEVPPIESCPDGVFIEDTMVAFHDTIVISRPGADSRKPEITDAESTVTKLGYNIKRIVAPGTLDGGDILKVGSTVYVGLSGRTNQAGVDQLSHILTPLGAKVVPIPVKLVLHLKSAVTALPDGTVIGYLPLVDDPKAFNQRFMSVPEESGAHVVLLGEKRLLIAASCPQTHSLLRSMGYDLDVVDISEYEKLEGCVTCLSVRLRHAPSHVSTPFSV